MKLTVKTLKGGKFEVNCETSNSVAQVKGIIESQKAELPAASIKLIHSGKVLKDDQTIGGCGIQPNDFLVVMVTKPKKVPAPAPAAAAAAAEAPKTPVPAAGETPAETPAVAAPPAAPSGPAEEEFPAEVINNLTSMGFPDAEVRHCLRAANGNPDVAVEFLTNGIPPGMQPEEQAAALAAGGSSSSGGGALTALRNHPQFNDLRRLVQSNPQMLQTVLTQIGEQQPELLAEINANQEAFLAMMNEPVTETSSSLAPAPSAGSSSSPAPVPSGASGGIPAGMLEGMANPAQMAQMIQNMSPNELNQMAAMMGLSPDQLRTTAQMLGQIPPEQLQQYMMQAMQGGGAAGAGGGAPAGDGGLGGLMGGPQVLRLTEEEMAAVDRLTEMGFDRTEAAQAFLACDKNEALAANLLMDSMGDGGGFGFGGGGGGDSGNNNSGGGDNDEGDDMYD
jgi:UV excision repair protein RAD23